MQYNLHNPFFFRTFARFLWYLGKEGDCVAV